MRMRATTTTVLPSATANKSYYHHAHFFSESYFYCNITMDIKKNSIPTNTVTRKLTDLDSQTDNIYESLVIISRRANQIASELKQELNRKLADFSTTTDSLEETFENREQIEISRYYERMPKPTLIATEEFLEKEVYFRNPNKQ